MPGFVPLVLAMLVWLGLHIGVSGTPVRAAVVARTGEARFKAAFSVASIGALGFLIVAYRVAPTVPLWLAPDWLRWILAILMLPAFVLLVAAIMARSPTGGGGEMAQEPRGVLRVTRHPMLWSFVIWATVHVIGTGDLASPMFFGTFLVTALAGMPSVDAKLAARNPEVWRRFAAVTSIVPGGAIAAGRNSLVLAEADWVAPLVGLAAWLVLLWLHPALFGVQPLPIR